jgi:hypothetical protein
MRKRIRALLSLAAIARAAVRVSFYHRRRALLELIACLRTTPRGWYCDPRLDVAVLERLLPVLPPFGAGRCIKRSLFLLDLWSRAGLAPSFHLGLRGSEQNRAGHAWVSTKEAAFATHQPSDVLEAFRA